MSAGLRSPARIATTLLAGGIVAGCYPVPPPLMDAAAPLQPHHLVDGAALSASLAPNPTTMQAMPIPAFEIWFRVPIGTRADAGLRLTGAPSVMADLRSFVLRAPRLSLSLALELGAVAVFGGGADTPFSFVNPPFAPLADAPVVLGWRLGDVTLVAGLRPGLRLIIGTTQLPFVTSPPNFGTPAVRGLDPLLGGALGVEIPVADDTVVHVEADAFQSFVNPSTILNLCVGLSRY